jgi:hypothetical protein
MISDTMNLDLYGGGILASGVGLLDNNLRPSPRASRPARIGRDSYSQGRRSRLQFSTEQPHER